MCQVQDTLLTALVGLAGVVKLKNHGSLQKASAGHKYVGTMNYTGACASQPQYGHVSIDCPASAAVYFWPAPDMKTLGIGAASRTASDL